MTETTASLTISLLTMGRLPLHDAMTMYKATCSAQTILEHHKDIREILPEASDRIVAYMAEDLSYYINKAEEEQEWCMDNNVRILTISDKDYPLRLRECPDAPMALFVRGTCDLNASHMLSIVGTRQSTPYGKDVTDSIVDRMTELCPDIVIVSGLAYGIDINAHRAALRNNIATIGVVAHGQDRIYPQLHRNDANKMVTGNGAVMTEYFHGTRPEARNFLQRNRIIAGLCDATVVIESAQHGGGMVTASIAHDYNRELFAIPGPVNAEYSKGCNNLIRSNKATLATSADDIISTMMWQDAAKVHKARREGIERTLFPTLTADEETIVNTLKEHGDCQTNIITQHTGLPVSTIIALLFSLEMKGVVTPLPGNVYHLIS